MGGERIMKRIILLLCIHIFPILAEYIMRYFRELRVKIFDARPEYVATILIYIVFGVLLSVLSSEVRNIGSKVAVGLFLLSIVVTIIIWLPYYHISSFGLIMIGYWFYHMIIRIMNYKNVSAR